MVWAFVTEWKLGWLMVGFLMTEIKIETILRSNVMGGYHDKRWSGLSEKMFPWTNDFPDVKCTDPNCTKIHPEDNEYYVPE